MQYALNLIRKSVFLFILIISFCSFFSAENEEMDFMTRSEIESELKEIKSDLQECYDVAYYEFLLGNFEEAVKILENIIEKDNYDIEVLNLYTQILYMKGNYSDAEMILDQIAESVDDESIMTNIQIKLFKIFYQTNQFEKAENLDKLTKYEETANMLSWMKLFNGVQPYEMHWLNGLKQTEVEILSLNPLPIIMIELEDKPVIVFIDTGADTFVLDSQTASELNVETVEGFMGSFAGGLNRDVLLGKVNSIKIGEMLIKNVPVSIMPVRFYTDYLRAYFESMGIQLPEEFVIQGIVGTKILQQVLASINYNDDILLLAENNRFNLNKFENNLKKSDYIKIPFYLDNLHTMVVRGQLNGKNVLFNMDSGLASSSPIQVYGNTIRDFGFEMPETSYDENAIGGGGTGFESAVIDNFFKAGIGNFMIENFTTDYEGGKSDFEYWDSGFIIDALLSHGYLSNFTWTIDFKNMNMYLENH